MKPSDSVGVKQRNLDSQISQVNELYQLIEVSEPYYALRNVNMVDNNLVADIPLELTSHPEPFGMSLGEAGRHMAILGSLALAKINPAKKKHFYLATDACFERLHSKPGGAGMYKGIISKYSIQKRTGEVEGILVSPFNEVLYKASVKYSVIDTVLFQRMFSKQMQNTEKIPYDNPYRNEPKLFGTKLGLKISTATSGIIEKRNCAGHFDNFPAIPIARLGGSLIKLSGLHFNYVHSREEEYCPKKAIIHASTFIFAGTKIDFNSKVISDEGENGIYIHAMANTTKCNNAVEMKLWYY